MLAKPNRKACSSSRLEIANIRGKFGLLHVTQAAQQILIRIRLAAQTAAIAPACAILTHGLGLLPAHADVVINEVDFEVRGGNPDDVATFNTLNKFNSLTDPNSPDPDTNGKSIGTLSVDCSITLNAGSVYAVEVKAAGEADRLVIDGGATIDPMAKVNASPENSTDTGFQYAPSTAYTILNATDGITGSFGRVTDSFAFLDSSLDYDYGTPNQVILTLDRNQTNLESVVVMGNQRNVAIAVSNLNADDDVLDAILTLSADEARSAFDDLSVEVHSSINGAPTQNSGIGRTVVNNRLRSAFDSVAANEEQAIALDGSSRSPMGWFESYRQWSSISETDNTAIIESQTAGFVAGGGLETNTLRGWRMGLFAGYGNSSVALNGLGYSGDANSFALGGYVGYQINDLGFRFGASNAWNNVTTDRSVTVGGFSDGLLSTEDYAASAFQAFGEVSYTQTTWFARIEPFSGLALINQRTQDFVEEDGTAVLRANNSPQTVGAFSLGTRFERQLESFGDRSVFLDGSLRWRRALGDLAPVKTMRLLQDNAFSTTGAAIEQDAVLLNLDLRHEVGGVFFGVSYYSKFADLAQNQGFGLSASFNF